MEPFELKIHQVTFEEGDVNAVYSEVYPGSIINCDYDSFDAEPQQTASGDQLKQTQKSRKPNSNSNPSPVTPVPASRPRAAYQPAWGQYGGEESSAHEQFLVNPNENFLYTAYTTTTSTPARTVSSSPRHNGGQVTSSSHHTLAQISVNTGAVAKHLSKVKKRQARTTLVTSTPTAVTTMPSEKASTPPTPREGGKTPEDPSDSSFETVAEALKLQWSVIGNKNIAPAPPEVVAQIVADAERRLRASGGNINTNAAPGSSEAAGAGALAAAALPESIPDDVSSLSSLSSTRNSSISSITTDIRTPAGNGKESPGPVATKVTSPPFPQPAAGQLSSPTHQSPVARVASPSPQPGAAQQRELIRIPAESMVRTTEKSKTTWFGSKEGQVSKAGAMAAEESRSPSKPGSPGVEAGSLPAGSRKSGGPGPRGRGSDSSKADVDGRRAEGEKRHQDDTASISSMSSDLDTERLAGTDSESLNSYQSGSAALPMSPSDQSRSSPTQFPPLPSQLPLLPLPKLGPLFTPTPRPAPRAEAPVQRQSSMGQTRGNAQLEARLEELLRERAKLSGQLEVLSQENQSTMQERAQLQAQLASLRLKLLATQDSRNNPETLALRREVTELHHSREALEGKLTESQRVGEERLEEAQRLQEELAAASEAGDKLALRLKELRDELRSRDATIQALKSKVAELYVEVQTAMQAKMEADQTARTATNDVAALQSAKDWYGQQLALAHEVRSKLQRELTQLQAQASAHGAVVERLRLQNAQLRSALAEAQQRALKEKEALARHLEAIETDMMEREAAFQEIQRERRLIEDTYSVHAQTAEEEKSRIALLMQSNKEMEARLDKSMEDMKKKQSQIFSMENEQIELMKKLALAQESLQEKENSCEELRQRLVEVEASLEGMQTSLSARERELQGLREERATKEIALAAALQEKASVDQALEKLQGDMGKVEKSFKQMRSELGTRLAELEKVTKEKASMSEELDRVQKELDIKRRSYDSIHRDFTDKTDALNTLRAEQQAVGDEATFLRKQLSELQASQQVTLQEKTTAEAALAESRARLAALEYQLQQIQTLGVQPQRQALQGSEAPPAPDSTSNHVDSGVMTNHVDAISSAEVTSTVEQPAQPALDKRVQSLQEENGQLQQQLVELEEEVGRLVVVEREGREKAGQELNTVRAELCEAKQSWSEEVAGLTARLQEAVGEKQRLQTEMEMLHRKQEVNAMQQQDQLRTELQRLMTELEAAQLARQKVEEGLERLQVEKEAQVAGLQAEVERLVAMETTYHDREQQYQQLALDLETERGRIAGLLQNNTALKQHVGQLEEALAGRESALQELHGQLSASMEQAQTRDQEYMARIRAMEDALTKEKEGQRGLRKQIGTKMTENSKLKKQSAAAKAELEAVEGELAGARESLQSTQAALEASRQEAQSAQTQLSTAQARGAELQAQLEKVKRQLEDNLARQPFIQDQIQNLQWQLEQKAREVATVMETMRLAEERQQQELEALRRQLEEKQGEVDELQQQLTSSRQEKLDQRQRVTQLRGALKATIHHHKLSEKIRSKRKSSGGSRDQGTQVEPCPEDLVIPPLPIDLAEVEKLLEDTAVRALDSKPLDNLKSCLSSLRSEISGLQEKMDLHTTTVHTTTQSWRSVESQVQELTEVVRTIANTINETKNTNTSTASVATESEEAEGVETV